MRALRITPKDQHFHIDGYPEAVKVLKLTGSKAQRLADLSLHRSDLAFALECLHGINKLSTDELAPLRQGLWHSAIVHFLKCFGSNESRFQLNKDKVYKGHPLAIVAFDYFADLRNKHLVHDENAYAQALPGAILNKRECKKKIAEVVCTTVNAQTLNQQNFSNLHSSITFAIYWVEKQSDELCAILADELEADSYENLLARESPTYRVPNLEEIAVPRTRYVP